MANLIPWRKGQSGNPGGRPRMLVAIERMLDENHRGVAHMATVFDRLLALAMGELVTVTGAGGEVTIQLRADPAFMKLYLDRVLGPVKARDDDVGEAVEAKLMELIAQARAARTAP